MFLKTHFSTFVLVKCAASDRIGWENIEVKADKEDIDTRTSAPIPLPIHSGARPGWQPSQHDKQPFIGLYTLVQTSTNFWEKYMTFKWLP